MERLPIKNGKLICSENDRLEFKSVLKGIPGSVWETYSSFANTFGGRIILGIEDKTRVIEGVPDAEKKIQDLWNLLNNPQVVNRNILYNNSIYTYEADGKTLIIIDVPRADRYLRPIYYKTLESGTFKRNGEGDYRCKMPEIAAMIRDQSAVSYDSTILEGTSFKDIDVETLRAYRNEMRVYNPDHMWNGCTDEEFASMIGAVGHSSEQLTAAGLLMFGKEQAIYAYFPRFKLDYMEHSDDGLPWSYRRVTGDGLWNGNIFNYFLTVRNRISSDLELPFEIGKDMRRIADNDVRKAVRETLLNSLIHADYLGDLVVKIEKWYGKIRVANSGLFRIPVEVAEKGGESDPRNASIAKMFSLIGFVERAGVGINYIFNVWKKRFGRVPKVTEDTDNQRTIVELNISKDEGKDVDKIIIEEISLDPSVSAPKISTRAGVSVPTVKNHMKSMKEQGIIRRIGGTRGRWELIQ